MNSATQTTTLEERTPVEVWLEAMGSRPVMEALCKVSLTTEGCLKATDTRSENVCLSPPFRLHFIALSLEEKSLRVKNF